jgi:hypothetical protein
MLRGSSCSGHGLELCERKLSCTVLRGLDGSNPVRLLGNPGGAWKLESKCRDVEQERLAIIRHNYVSVEYVRGLGECQIIGYLLEAPTFFHLLHPDILEQESLS